MARLVDRWVIAHVVCWAGIAGWLTWFFDGLPAATLLAVTWAGTIAWEAVEYEREVWLEHGHEEWRNRLIVDPLSNTAGALAGWYVAGLLF